MASALHNLGLWCIVQADGDKACLTTRGSVPIQYCTTEDAPSLVQRSIHRALRITNPRRVVATVAQGHWKWWWGPLWCVPACRRIADESTGRQTVTLSAALALIERAAQDAVVVLQPADTFFAGESAFLAGVRRAMAALDKLPGHVFTLTVDTYTSAPGQDYLLLGAEDGLPGRSAVRLVKRPEPLVAERLVSLGALLSTGVYLARLSTLTSILSDLWPDLMATARSLAATGISGIVTPARMTGSQFIRPWRHTWVQRPLPRLRAVSVDDLEWFPVAAMASSAEAEGFEERDQSCALVD